MTEASHLVRRFHHEVWNRADEDTGREIPAPDFRFRGSLGADGFTASLRLIHAACADYHCEMQAPIEDGPRPAARMRFSGRHRGPRFGIAVTGPHRLVGRCLLRDRRQADHRPPGVGRRGCREAPARH
ncbi:ester cyclase [Sediminicoccus sp. BL-A-41-H5]|uniref:ester cyclase n=1 Tax=Sediminicoccus sp. BL-A-41-H5 TaxID=3421106 RepID=UPI003D676839